jgi:hypothetical protein
MSKYISIFFLSVLASALLFIILGSVYMVGGDAAEEAVYTIGTIYFRETGSPSSLNGCLKSNAKESGPCWI